MYYGEFCTRNGANLWLKLQFQKHQQLKELCERLVPFEKEVEVIFFVTVQIAIIDLNAPTIRYHANHATFCSRLYSSLTKKRFKIPKRGKKKTKKNEKRPFSVVALCEFYLFFS